MAAAKGTAPPNAGKGRKAGIPNKTTREVKEMILQALENVGGVEYLMERANDDRTRAAFLSLVGKVLPLQITGEGGGPVQIEAIQRTVVDRPETS